jgi:drug/metabolite transporter (DMT)-like permease
MSLFNVFSGTYTIMSHSLIFSNLGGILIVIHSLIARRFVHKLEIVGTIIAIVGCMLTVLDNKAKKVDSSQQNILLGDFLAFISSLFSAFYYQFNQQIVSKMPPLLGITSVMFCSQVMLQVFGCLFISNFDISTNPETGSFGFINVDYWVYVVFALGFVTGTCSYGATAMVLKYCSPLVLCTALLFTPLVG